MVDEDRLAEHAANWKDKYLQAITNSRVAAEKANDRETVTKLVELYDEIQDNVVAIDNERRQRICFDRHAGPAQKEEIQG